MNGAEVFLWTVRGVKTVAMNSTTSPRATRTGRGVTPAALLQRDPFPAAVTAGALPPVVATWVYATIRDMWAHVPAPPAAAPRRSR